MLNIQLNIDQILKCVSFNRLEIKWLWIVTPKTRNQILSPIIKQRNVVQQFDPIFTFTSSPNYWLWAHWWSRFRWTDSTVEYARALKTLHFYTKNAKNVKICVLLFRDDILISLAPNVDGQKKEICQSSPSVRKTTCFVLKQYSVYSDSDYEVGTTPLKQIYYSDSGKMFEIDGYFVCSANFARSALVCWKVTNKMLCLRYKIQLYPLHLSKRNTKL